MRDVPFFEGGRARGLQAVVGVPIVWGGGGRRVRGDGGHVGEEGFALRGAYADERFGLLLQNVGHVVAITSSEVTYGALVVRLVVVIAEGAGPEPTVPAWGDVGVALVVAV